MTLRVDGARRYAEVARALRLTANRELQRELISGMNRAVKPAKPLVRQAALDTLPTRGGLGERVARSRVSLKRRGGRYPRISIVALAPRGETRRMDIRSLNRGRLRHPLWGNREHWFVQQVRPGWWDSAVAQIGDRARREIRDVIDQVSRKVL